MVKLGGGSLNKSPITIATQKKIDQNDCDPFECGWYHSSWAKTLWNQLMLVCLILTNDKKSKPYIWQKKEILWKVDTHRQRTLILYLAKPLFRYVWLCTEMVYHSLVNKLSITNWPPPLIDPSQNGDGNHDNCAKMPTFCRGAAELRGSRGWIPSECSLLSVHQLVGATKFCGRGVSDKQKSKRGAVYITDPESID